MTNAHSRTPPTIYTTHSSHPTSIHKYMNRQHIPHTACIHSNTQLHRHMHQMLHMCRFTHISHTNTYTYHTHLTFPAWLKKLFCTSIVTKIQYKQCIIVCILPPIQNCKILSSVTFTSKEGQLLINYLVIITQLQILQQKSVITSPSLFPVIGKITCNYQMSFGSGSILRFFDDNETIIYSSQHT